MSDPPSERVDFLGHVLAAFAHVRAVPKSSVAEGAGDDELHAALQAMGSLSAQELIAAARREPEYHQLIASVEADPLAVAAVRLRWEDLMAAVQLDLGTPFAEGDGESGQFVAEAAERGHEAMVLLAVLIDLDRAGAEFLARETSLDGERAARDRLLGEASKRVAETLLGPAATLHRYLSARRTASSDEDAAAEALIAALRLLGDARSTNGQDWADQAYELILSRVERPGGFRRAELNTPMLLAYLEKSTHLKPRDQTLMSLDESWEQGEREGPIDYLSAPNDPAAEVELLLETADLIETAGLTPRERDVWALLVQDLSHAEMGQRLSIAQGTVGVHVASLKNKLRRARKST